MKYVPSWLKIPSGETMEVEAAELWEVRWTSRHGEYHSDVRPVVKVFTQKEDAENFRVALQNAFALLQHTGNGSVVPAVRKHA